MVIFIKWFSTLYIIYPDPTDLGLSNLVSSSMTAIFALMTNFQRYTPLYSTNRDVIARTRGG